MAGPSTTGSAEGTESRVRRRGSGLLAKPVLASEVLLDEVAPLEPGRSSVRGTFLALAAGMLALGVGHRLGLGLPVGKPDQAPIAFAAAGALAAVGLLPFSYGPRAALGFLLGIGLMALGLRGAGPLGGLAMDGGELRDGARLLTLTAVPAALMIRARYSSYAVTRWLLASALGISIPFLVLQGLLLADGTAPAVLRVAAAVILVVVACGALGFVTDLALGHHSPWAWLVLAVLPLDIGVRELTPLAGADTGVLTYPLTAAAMACVGLLTSLGLYQLWALAIGPRARRALKKASAIGGITVESP